MRHGPAECGQVAFGDIEDNFGRMAVLQVTPDAIVRMQAQHDLQQMVYLAIAYRVEQYVDQVRLVAFIRKRTGGEHQRFLARLHTEVRGTSGREIHV